MENLHLHEEQIYLISNHAVARNPIFNFNGIRDRFQDKMLEYLEPVSHIMASNMKGHEYRILLRLKSRKDFDEFYQNKPKKSPGIEETPLSTHIFSQQMSNLQVSLVKHFNFKFDRSGGLFARRFMRRLITSEKEVKQLVKELESGKVDHSYNGFWAEMGKKLNEGLSTSYIKFKDEKNKRYAEFHGIKIDLAAQFNNCHNLKNYPPPIYCNKLHFRSLVNYALKNPNILCL